MSVFLFLLKRQDDLPSFSVSYTIRSSATSRHICIPCIQKQGQVRIVLSAPFLMCNYFTNPLTLSSLTDIVLSGSSQLRSFLTLPLHKFQPSFLTFVNALAMSSNANTS